jgi:hypothetical protein
VLDGVVALAARIHRMYQERTGASRWTLGVVLAVASVIGAAHAARVGSAAGRVLAIGILAGFVVSMGAVVVMSRRAWRDARRALTREVAGQDPALAARLDRAAALAARSRLLEEPEETRELSDLHLSRQLSQVRVDRLESRAEGHARGLSAAAFVLAAGAMAVAALDPFRIVEGLDVLFARDGEAPLRLVYVDDVDVVATPPSYIGRHEELLTDFDRTDQPRGTILTVRGRPERQGRALVLTDGVKEVEFVDDGRGNVLARWTVQGTVELRIAAKLGEVRISQRETLTVESIPDLPPEVKLAGAPQTVKLVDAPRLTLAYEAADDHGLTEIALVLRSGASIESRTLSKPGGAKKDRGAHELSTQEPFFRGTFVPVEVTVEAKDNDAVAGPKWGASAAFIVLPPLVGEPEALRYAALLKVRDTLVDLLAPRVLATVKTPADAKGRVELEQNTQEDALAIVEELIAGSYAGLSVRGRVRRVIAGQMRRLRDAMKVYADKPSPKAFEDLVKTNEQVVLAIDAAIQRLGAEDARKVSKALADVAKEAAEAARAAREPEGAQRGMHRLAAALKVLEGGGKELQKLGSLGADLGDIAVGGVGRIARERDRPDLIRAELAAKDLEKRLRRPVPSIGGGGGKPGVESGGGGGSEVDTGDASEADEAAETDGRELDELIKRHQDEIDRVEKALEGALTPEEREALKELAKQKAKEIREAVKDLPDQGFPGSAAEKAAEGKKGAESMAGSLEKGNLKDAIKQGKAALEALREAKKRGDSGAYADDEDIAKDATKAGNRVEEALDELEKSMSAAEDSAKERAGKDLKDAGKNEGRLSERTRDLKKRGERGDSSMPDDVLDRLDRAQKAMKEAQEALESGDVDKGKQKQKEAQRQLEMASDDEDPSDSDPKGQDGEETRSFSQDAEVPDKDTHKGPEEFRKRVMDGLSKPGEARLKDAVKRYAEGLLK